MRRAAESAEKSGSGVPEGTIPRPRFRDRLWGFGAMVVGLALLLSAGRVGNHALRQSEWSSSEGTVTAAHLSSRTKGSSGGTWISAEHRYSYEVDGILYQADRYSWGSVGGSSPAAADER